MVHPISDYAKQNGDRVAVSDGVTELSWTQLNTHTNGVIHALRGLGLVPGDNVAIMANNSTAFGVVSLAIHLSGMSLVPINWHFTADEAAYLIDNAHVKVLFAGSQQLAVAREAVGSGSRVNVIELDSFQSEIEENQPGGEPEGETIFASPIYYTSGTTGKPKATRLSQAPTSVPIHDALTRIKNTARLSGLEETTRHLVQGPLYHAGPQNNAITTLLIGAFLYIMRRFDPEETLRLIDRYRITHSMMVPTMFVRLDRLAPDIKAKYDVSSLQSVPHIAAPMPVDVKERMIDWWGPVLVDAYGCSEIGVITRITSQEWLEKKGSVGRPIDGFTIQIIDDSNEEVPAGKVGMIYMTSFTDVDLEYLDDPEKTKAAHRQDKQFTLGDMGWLDSEGYLYLSDRRVDMIISGGVNIYPAEIEAALLANTYVEDAAVFGIPNEEWGQEVKAAVQLREGYSPSPKIERTIVDWLRARVAHYKVPRTIDFHERLPRYSNGKLHRRVLRDAYWSHPD